MGTGRVHGDRESTWGEGEYMGTGRVNGNSEGKWGQGKYMGTERANGDREITWGQGEYMGTGMVHGGRESTWGQGYMGTVRVNVMSIESNTTRFTCCLFHYKLWRFHASNMRN